MDQFTMLSSFDDPIYIFILQSFSKDLGTFKWKALITFELLFPQNTSFTCLKATLVHHMDITLTRGLGSAGCTSFI